VSSPRSAVILGDRSDRALVDSVLNAIVIVIGALDDVSLSVRLHLEHVRTHLGAKAAAHAHVLIDDGLGHRLLLPTAMGGGRIAQARGTANRADRF
jgi:hypothetical protein